MTTLNRRQFFKITVGAAAAWGLLKGAVHSLGGPKPTGGLPELRFLSERQARIARAIGLAMVGPAGATALAEARWDPVVGLEDLMASLHPEQRELIGTGLWLFEVWGVQLRGFSQRSLSVQTAKLSEWRESSLGVQRSMWGVFHAAFCSSFSGTEAGWDVMDYPGPALGRRQPGQTARFAWDESVP